jgi:hypothetical protein
MRRGDSSAHGKRFLPTSEIGSRIASPMVNSAQDKKPLNYLRTICDVVSDRISHSSSHPKPLVSLMPYMPSAAALAMVGIELGPFHLFESDGFPVRGCPIRVWELLAALPVPTVGQRPYTK